MAVQYIGDCAECRRTSHNLSGPGGRCRQCIARLIERGVVLARWRDFVRAVDAELRRT